MRQLFNENIPNITRFYRGCFLFVCSTFVFPFNSQNTDVNLSLNDCLKIALEKNESIKVAELQSNYHQKHKKALYEIPKASLMYTQGQFNSIYPYDNIIAISQSLPFPGYFKAQSELGKAEIRGAEIHREEVVANLRYQVKLVFFKLQHLMQESRVLNKEDSIFEIFLKMVKNRPGGISKSELEEAASITKAHLIQNTYNRILEEVNDNRIQLQYLLRTNSLPQVMPMSEEERILTPDTLGSGLLNQPYLRYLQEQIEIHKRIRVVEQQKSVPDLHLSYFNQSIYGPANIYGEDYFLTTGNRLQGFQIGLIFPMYYGPAKAKIKSGRVLEQLAEEQYNFARRDMEGRYKQAVNKYLLNKKNLDYYKKYILEDSRKMIVKSLEAYNNKEINYVEYLALIDVSFSNIRDYLHMILENNMAVIEIEYFLTSGL